MKLIIKNMDINKYKNIFLNLLCDPKFINAIIKKTNLNLDKILSLLLPLMNIESNDIFFDKLIQLTVNHKNIFYSIYEELYSRNIIQNIIFNIPIFNKQKYLELKELFIVYNDTYYMKIYGTINNIKSNKYLIYSHGNSSDLLNISEILNTFSSQFNINIITYDYPKYGLSESDGYLTETLCYHSHELVVDYIIDKYKINQKDIILFGQSLGTGIVIDYISKYNWNGQVLLMSPYKSIPRILYDNPMMDLTLPDYKFDSINKISKIKCPVTIVHGLQDNLIPHYHSKDLYNEISVNYRKNSKLLLIDGDHSDIIFKLHNYQLSDLF